MMTLGCSSEAILAEEETWPEEAEALPTDAGRGLPLGVIGPPLTDSSDIFFISYQNSRK
ncbi:hypothetical protein J2S74_003479 [Evansella vedderi]|uniref:Uncharacterized protein n=2 Tax=Evansella vedderi TaxID=38282 RepID=A0ABT9ZXW3_9BACI|nr:hypothetical protein [Evansella vedderi]